MQRYLLQKPAGRNIQKRKNLALFVWTAVIEDRGRKTVTFEVGNRDEETFLKDMGENSDNKEILL
ncbi:hypothetical protein [Desulfurobacterium crinifex]